MDRAIGRIEAALARIEQAASKRPAGNGGVAGPDDALRRRVGIALEELDTLIGGLER